MAKLVIYRGDTLTEPCNVRIVAPNTIEALVETFCYSFAVNEFALQPVSYYKAGYNIAFRTW